MKPWGNPECKSLYKSYVHIWYQLNLIVWVKVLNGCLKWMVKEQRCVFQTSYTEIDIRNSFYRIIQFSIITHYFSEVLFWNTALLNQFNCQKWIYSLQTCWVALLKSPRDIYCMRGVMRLKSIPSSRE